jgi:hypothetical protein
MLIPAPRIHLYALSLCTAVAASACGSPDPTTPLDGTAPADESEGSAGHTGTSATAFSWTGEYPVHAGAATEMIRAPLPSNASAWVLRAQALGASGPFCPLVDSVKDAEGYVWVPPAPTQMAGLPYCTDCAERVSVGYGYGLFAFPSNGEPLPPTPFLDLRVVFRDCLTYLPLAPALAPASVQLDGLAVSPLAEGEAGRLHVFVLLHRASAFRAETAAEDAVLQGGLAKAAEVLDEAGIDLSVVGYADLDGSGAPVVFSRVKRGALDALDEEARRAAPGWLGRPDSMVVPIIVGPCLVEKDPLFGTTSRPMGYVPRIPGGFPVDGHADGVFLQGAACDPKVPVQPWPSGEPLGKVLAHELGHYLGLYHSVEKSGQEDALDDTAEGNLMFHSPLASSAKGLSPRQIQVLRNHPYVLRHSYSVL